MSRPNPNNKQQQQQQQHARPTHALGPNKSIKVLVCSGNLGNARPDPASLNAWIPSDGKVSDVVTTDPPYPLPPASEQRLLWDELKLSQDMPIFEVDAARIAELAKNDDDDAAPEASSSSDRAFDFICIGMQEATFDVPEDDPLIRLPVIEPLFKKTVGKVAGKAVGAGSSLAKSKNHIKKTSNNSRIETDLFAFLEASDTKVIQEMLLTQLPSYEFVVRFQRGEMRLEILRHKESPVSLEVMKVRAQNTGLGVNGVLNAANKGGIAAELLLNQTTRLAVCTAHLQAHEGHDHYKTRNKSVEMILEGTSDETTISKQNTRTRNVKMDLASKSHVCFFLGDLNYRTNLLRDSASEKSQVVAAAVASSGDGPNNHYYASVDSFSSMENSILSDSTSFSTLPPPPPTSPSMYASGSYLPLQDSNGALLATASPSSGNHKTSSTNRFQQSLANLTASFSTINSKTSKLDKKVHNQMVRAMVEDEQWFELNVADELFNAIQRRDAFCGFYTLPCFFPPTFKVERSAGFHYKEQRRPSYTDRILWHTIHHMEELVRPLVYEPIMDFTSSDHKPVRAAFEIDIIPRLRVRPPMQRRRSSVFGRGSSTLMGSSGFRRRQSLEQNAMFAEARLANHATAGVGKADSHKTLHLYVSNIAAGIRPKSTGPIDLAPDPYVCFISIPKHLIKQPVSNWSRFMGFFRFGANLQLDQMVHATTGDTIRTVHGFPRTRKLTNTYSPSWNNDEDEPIHIVVKHYLKDGITPIQLGGAVVMICVFNHLPSLEDNMLGCFPLNLNFLYQQGYESEQQQQIMTDNNNNKKVLTRHGSYRCDDLTNESKGEHMHVRSSWQGGGSGESNNNNNNNTNDKEILQTLDLKQPLMKNGKQIGWISCTIDSYWMKPDESIRRRRQQQ